MEIIFDYCCKRNCWMWYKDSCFASAVKHAWWRIATRNMLCSHYPGAVCLCTLCTRTNTAQEKHALINLTFLPPTHPAPMARQMSAKARTNQFHNDSWKNTILETWLDDSLGKIRPSVNYAKDWLDQLFLFSGLEKVSPWMWPLGGSQQPFSCILGHFRHGDTQPNKQTNNQSIQEQACSLPLRRRTTYNYAHLRSWKYIFAEEKKTTKEKENNICGRKMLP